FEDGYVVYRHRLGYQTWQFLCVARQDGLIPCLSEAALWRQLSSERYSTPLLHDWVPWLRSKLEERKLLLPLTCFNCRAATLCADTQHLDELVKEGVSQGHLHIA